MPPVKSSRSTLDTTLRGLLAAVFLSSSLSVHAQHIPSVSRTKHSVTQARPGVIADYSFSGSTLLLLHNNQPSPNTSIVLHSLSSVDDILTLRCDETGLFTNEAQDEHHTPISLSSLIHVQPTPNPNPSCFDVFVPDFLSKSLQDYSLRLYDLRGRDVTSESSLPAGNYLARFLLGGEVLSQTKLVFTNAARDVSSLLSARINTFPVPRQQDKDLSSLVVLVQAFSPGYESLVSTHTLHPDQDNHLGVLYLRSRPVEYRLVGQARSSLDDALVGGVLVVQTHSDGALHDEPIDTAYTNSFELTISGYEPSEIVSVWLDNPYYTNKQARVVSRSVDNGVSLDTLTLKELSELHNGFFVYVRADSTLE